MPEVQEDDGSDRRREGKTEESIEKLYESIAVDCFRYFGFTTFDQVDNLTPRQYQIRVKAMNLQNVDRSFWIHLQAFQNYRVQATKQVGKKSVPVYKKFDDFYDYETAIRNANKKKTKISGLGSLLRKEEQSG